MAPKSIEVDGHIDLIDQSKPAAADRGSADRSRRSRLNDVMIVLEREQSDLQARMNARIATNGIELESDGAFKFQFESQAPKFHAAIETPEPLTPAQKVTVETEIATEIFDTIQSYVNNTQSRRWQPSVTATVRSGSNSVESTVAHIDGGRSWLKTLLWIGAAITLGVIFFYLRQLN